MKIKPVDHWLCWKFLLSIQRWLLFGASLAAVLMITYNVVLRYITKSDLFGQEELMAILAMWIYYIGAAYGSYEDSHIKADFLGVIIKNPRLLKARNIFCYAAVFLISLVITKWGLDYFSWSYQAGGRTSGYHIPSIVSQIPITISFIMMTIYSTYHLVRQLRAKPAASVPAIEGAEAPADTVTASNAPLPAGNGKVQDAQTEKEEVE